MNNVKDQYAALWLITCCVLMQAAGSMSTAEEDFSMPAVSEAGGSTTSGRAASFDPLGMVCGLRVML